jgi:hypothetical protein
MNRYCNINCKFNDNRLYTGNCAVRGHSDWHTGHPNLWMAVRG